MSVNCTVSGMSETVIVEISQTIDVTREDVI